MIKTAMVYLLLDKCLDLLEQNLNNTFILPTTQLVPGHYRSITIDTGNTLHILYNVKVTDVGTYKDGIDGMCVEFTLYGNYITKVDNAVLTNPHLQNSSGINYVVPIKNIKSFD